MHKIEFYFEGGSCLTFTAVDYDTADKIINWINDKDNTQAFQIDSNKINTTSFIRKEKILYINVI